MNKQDLELAKKIAEIDGVEVEVVEPCRLNDHRSHLLAFKFNADGVVIGEYNYNPFCWCILGPLMVEYEVEPDYDSKYVQIYNSPLDHYTVDFKCKEEIPRAILQCIVKSQGVI